MKYLETKINEKERKYLYELDDNDIDMLKMALSEYYYKNANAIQQDIIRKYFKEFGSDIKDEL